MGNQIYGNTEDGGSIVNTEYNATYTVLRADDQNRPTSLYIKPSNFIGRKATGGIVSLNATDISDIISSITITINGGIQFDSTLATDHSYFGEYESGSIGATVVFGNLLSWDISEAKWKLADADALSSMGRLTLALESGVSGNSKLVLIKGYARDNSWAWPTDDSSKFIYASITPGGLESTPVSGAGDISQIVGYIVSATKIFFDSGSYAQVVAAP